jgi:hypothetical protein
LSHSGIFLPEICPQRLLEAAAEEHGGAGVLLMPTIEITMAITPGQLR